MGLHLGSTYVVLVGCHNGRLFSCFELTRTFIVLLLPPSLCLTVFLIHFHNALRISSVQTEVGFLLTPPGKNHEGDTGAFVECIRDEYKSKKNAPLPGMCIDFEGRYSGPNDTNEWSLTDGETIQVKVFSPTNPATPSVFP